jgi:hypothetical protein
MTSRVSLGHRIVIDQKPADAPTQIDFRLPPAGQVGSPSGQRLEEGKEACSPVPPVVVILPVGAPRRISIGDRTC